MRTWGGTKLAIFHPKFQWLQPSLMEQAPAYLYLKLPRLCSSWCFSNLGSATVLLHRTSTTPLPSPEVRTLLHSLGESAGTKASFSLYLSKTFYFFPTSHAVEIQLHARRANRIHAGIYLITKAWAFFHCQLQELAEEVWFICLPLSHSEQHPEPNADFS